MEKLIRIYTSRKEMKADEYRYWQSRPVHERMAVAQLSLAAYALKEQLAVYQDFKDLLSAFNASGVKADPIAACSAVVRIFNLPADFQSAFREHRTLLQARPSIRRWAVLETRPQDGIPAPLRNTSY